VYNTNIRIWVNYINQFGNIRRIPGWPGENLTDLLIKFKTPYFIAPCDSKNTIRKVSDSKLPYTFIGANCGHCHVVSKIYNLNSILYIYYIL
jgi:hypothetical protein